MKAINQTTGGYKFGTFTGVFTPSILTIFGLIMFMRTTFVVGQAGIAWALTILFIAEIIVIATGLSISAISTNTPVKGGGAYFLISRALGPGFGSSIGLTLFFAQALSVPFYILGFSEALVKNFPFLTPYYALIALGTGVVISVLTWVGTGWAMKLQYFILTILGLSIISFMGGALSSFSWSGVKANIAPMPNADIFIIFSIFFPAVTGIMAGVNMSGDLKDPAKSLPLGTLAAILVGFVVYGLEIVFCGGAFSRENLLSQPFEILVKNALWGTGFIVTAGVVAATLSSALGSCVGAPRVLQALAKDKILKPLNPFGKGSGPFNEPRRALLLTIFITMAVLLWGGMSGVSKEGSDGGALNAVAIVVTMFFLYTYGMVNLAAFVESYGANPSFRPRFKFYHWSTALFGTAACVVVSLYINEFASLIALLIIAGLFVAAKRSEMRRTFGDARRGFIYSRIRNNLLQLRSMPPDPKNWRPTITVFTGNPNTRINLLNYSCLFECDRGILSLVEFIIAPSDDIRKERSLALKRLDAFVKENDLDVFPEVVVAEAFDPALTTFLQAYSIGPVKPNIIMMGWPKEQARILPFAKHLRTVLSIGTSCVLLVDSRGTGCPKLPHGRIDIWWRGQKNGSLMLILAYLLRSNTNWQHVKIRILRTISKAENKEDAHLDLTNLVEAARMDAEIKTILSDSSFDTILKENSSDATAVFLGFIPPKDDWAEDFFNSTNKRLSDMPPTFLVSSSGEADLLA